MGPAAVDGDELPFSGSAISLSAFRIAAGAGSDAVTDSPLTFLVDRGLGPCPGWPGRWQWVLAYRPVVGVSEPERGLALPIKCKMNAEFHAAPLPAKTSANPFEYTRFGTVNSQPRPRPVNNPKNGGSSPSTAAGPNVYAAAGCIVQSPVE